MEFHLGVVADRARQAYAQTLEATTGIQVFGTPSMPRRAGWLCPGASHVRPVRASANRCGCGAVM